LKKGNIYGICHCYCKSAVGKSVIGKGALLIFYFSSFLGYEIIDLYDLSVSLVRKVVFLYASLLILCTMIAHRQKVRKDFFLKTHFQDIPISLFEVQVFHDCSRKNSECLL